MFVLGLVASESVVLIKGLHEAASHFDRSTLTKCLADLAKFAYCLSSEMESGPDTPKSEVTRILQAAEHGEADGIVAEKLLPLVYDELRKLAAHRMARQPSNQTLQATALVHEAYLRLVGPDESSRAHWDSRGHFFAAAAEAMRRILIDRARQKQSLKRGGDMARTTWDESKVGAAAGSDEILAVDEALTKLNEEDPELAKIVKLRYFVGMTVPETATALGVSPSTVDRQWSAARAWLFREITEGK